MGKVKKTLKRVRLHREGTDILLVTLALLVIINILVWWVSHVAGIILTSITGILYLLLVNFFRSPKRNFTGNRENVVVSSVDGKVVALEEVYEPEYLKRKCIQISVFMTIFDVHANWFPVDGEVIYVTHHPGRFLSAWLPKSSTENERSTVVIRTDDGQEILMRQIAGAMARRIVTYAEPGNAANIEDHMGFIKFGSRVDIYLPLGTEILTEINKKTVGGVTPIARLRPEFPAVINE
ncbi:MAG: phosphatidylserine decarboxylase family protein [Bacteroides sp.]|nr:phosphatidylserine decarboxylase family protein [Bacteroides sp.]MCM1380214.1 phosphatidylserine decarboxylase family protein [Bacteroides sp.]MCM1446527.1 phosphatidylserine decarboxylase family protein [Prevotella sp.]